MKTLALLFISMFAVSAMAASSAEEAKLKALSKKGRGNKVTLTEVEAEKPGIKVDAEAVKKFRARALRATERDSVFAEAGVDNIVANWKDYDKDMLIVRAREFSAGAFTRAYPEFDSATAAKLQAAAQKR